MSKAQFPSIRMRRIRQTDWVRRMVAETRLSVDDLIWPIFIGDGENKREPVIAMPGVDRLSIDLAVEAAKKLWTWVSPAWLYSPTHNRKKGLQMAMKPAIQKIWFVVRRRRLNPPCRI